jgi:hypothetical protein
MTEEATAVAEVKVEPSETDKALTLLKVSKEAVEVYKEQFGSLGLAWVGGRPFLYRPIRRQELKKLRAMTATPGIDNELLAQEKVTCMCTLKPELQESDLAMLGAGLANTLSDLIYEISDFGADAPPQKL